MYTIGLIDDEEKQIRMIRRTIKTNAISGEPYDFKSYIVSDNAVNIVKEVVEEVIQDIKALRLSCLIIDYKIILKNFSKVKGTDIFKKIKDEVPKFPVIILTEVVEESMEPEFIDADKVYKKKDFYKIESEYSKEKVFNIFDSMRKYTGQRDKIQVTIDELKKKLTKGNLGHETIENILALESQLDDFVPIDQSQIDKVFDESKAKEIVALIEKANKLLE